jgi:phenylalanyl-tRNA synthetase alpha chain
MSELSQLEKLRQEALEQLRSVSDQVNLEQWRIRYLGTKGALKAAMAWLKDVPRDQKPEFGKRLNELKSVLREAYEASKAGVGKAAPAAAQIVDVTLPGLPLRLGHRHVLTSTVEEITEIFARMGFSVAYGPEVEDERHNFDALNIPPSHPARDELENFYIDQRTMLRSQTSTVQIRVMEQTAPPVRIIAPGRVYRPDAVDATHYFMFHQLEGLYVDQGVTMVDLRTTLDQFCKSYFGPDVKTRFRASFFPFTEPSAEIDIHFPDQGRWVELGGCGMVDPNVLEAVGYDSQKYTGFAFGMGIERMALRKHGIGDIRLLFENDVRFLRQF